MSWFRVDDGLPSSRKVLSIPRTVRCTAVGLWSMAGAWCMKELTDGRLPTFMVEELGGTLEMAEALVKCGLWGADGDEYVFHDWSDYQPSREEVVEKRQKNAARLRLWREKKAASNAVTNGVTNDSRDTVSTLSPTRPDPTRPDPLVFREEERPRKRGPNGTRLPEGWLPSEELRRQMAEECPGVDLKAEHRKFADHWKSQPGQKGVKLDWEATWRNWIRTSRPANGYSAPDRPRKSPPPEILGDTDKLTAWYEAQVKTA